METIDAELLDSKKDGRGRRILPEQEWLRLLAEYEKSGLTQKAFARREGINRHTFVAWLGRHRRGSVASDRNNAVGFHEVRLPSASAGDPRSMLEVHLPEGLVLKGASARDLAELVRALKG